MLGSTHINNMNKNCTFNTLTARHNHTNNTHNVSQIKFYLFTKSVE